MKKLKKSFGSEYPDLAKSWHPTKNGDLTPYDVTPKTHKRVWWKCEKEHEWDVRISDRSRGTGCPFCDGKRVCKENSLATNHPELAKQWHPTKNGDLTPFDVMPKSGKIVWWRCDKGHEWDIRICNRTNGTGCPFCDGKRVCKENSLATNHPELAKQWHPTKNGDLTPFDVLPKSNKRIWWKCEKGHEWETPIHSRTRKNASLCKFCSGFDVTEDNNFAIKYPKLAKQWHPTRNHPLKPNMFLPKSDKRVWWICKRGHEWQSQIKNRSNGRNCPDCKPQTSRLEIRSYCELKSIFSEVRWREKIDGNESDVYLPQYNLCIEIDGYPWHKNRRSNDIKKNSNLKQLGKEVIRIRENGLPAIEENDIFYKDGEHHLITINNLLNLLKKKKTFTVGETKNIETYLRKNEYQNEKDYNKIISELPSPIPERSFANCHPDIARLWHPTKNYPLEPHMFTVKSAKIVWWLCDNGHETQARIYQRVSTQCIDCSNQRILTIEEMRDLASKKGGECLSSTYINNQTYLLWQCKEKHPPWKAKARDIQRGRWCPYCSNTKLLSKNSLAAQYPNLALQWHPTKNGDLTPNEVAIRSNKTVHWICEKGHEWQAIIANRTIGYNRMRGNGCKKCNNKRA
jgi:hypothetical protein